MMQERVWVRVRTSIGGFRYTTCVVLKVQEGKSVLACQTAGTGNSSHDVTKVVESSVFGARSVAWIFGKPSPSSMLGYRITGRRLSFQPLQGLDGVIDVQPVS